MQTIVYGFREQAPFLDFLVHCEQLKENLLAGYLFDVQRLRL